MELSKELIKIDMWSEDSSSTGLLWTREMDGLPADERLIVEDAQKYEADAVYIRRFSGGKSAVTQVYIYDSEKFSDSENLDRLRKRLWNFSHVPILMVFSPDSLRIFNCFQCPFDKEGKIISRPFETIKLASEAKAEIEKRKAFSGRMFDNGSFWDSREGSKINRKESGYVQLLTQLKLARKNFINQKILSKSSTERLLILSILVKYLEDRRDEEGNTVFPEGFFSEIVPEANSYFDLLKIQGGCVALFDRLGRSDYFNGEFFKITDQERKEFSQTDLSVFADLFVSGELEGVQYTLWKQYSFDDLPTELISNIYEEFLDEDNVEEDGAVYTPPYLVNLLIDECMPIYEPRDTFKVMDPACGSGVFLVAAYKRLIIWWRQRNDWKKPRREHLPELKRLLLENIYGIDKNGSAVQLAMFSLTLAMCDELSPKEIWEELKFENLKGKNLFEEDFFQLLLDKKLPTDFDLIIGNPPFRSKLTPPAKLIERQTIKETGRPPVPDQQIALLFLEQAMGIAKPDAQVCLIIKAGPLLYNKTSFDFRQYLLGRYQVDCIFDFTPLEQILFGAAKVETAAIFMRNKTPETDHLFHITFRRTQVTKEKVYFELDAYDIHRVRYEDAMEKKLVWKANLLGGGRLHDLLDRVEDVRTLGEFLDEKVNQKENPWYVAEGFIVGNESEISRLKMLKTKENLNDRESADLDKLSKKYKEADHLTGKPTLPTEAFTEAGIDDTAIYALEETFFLRSRLKNKQIFSPPHLLIKEHVKEGAIPVEYREDYLTFKHQVIGIHAPDEEKEILKKIENRLRGDRNYSFWTACSSPKYLIERASALLKYDIINLPFPEEDSLLKIGELEQLIIDDVLNYHVDFRRKGENAESVKTVSSQHLALFAQSYCQVLNSVYEQFQPLTPIPFPSYIIFPFCYGSQPQIDIPDQTEIEAHLENLLKHQPGRNLRINRILRIYDNNIIYLIKPNQVRYWLRSIAIRDADETFADLVAQGY